MSEQSPVVPILAGGAQALGLELGPAQLDRFATLSDELIAWSARVNLTSITDPDAVQVRHFLDSLTIVPVIQRELPARSGKLIDVGAGGGFPGLPAAIVLPWLEVALLEATAKKVRFLEHVIGVLGLGNAHAIPGRAEPVAHESEHREEYDVAVARAVGGVATLVELLAPLLRVGGLAIFMKSQGGLDLELAAASPALDRLHASVEGVQEVRVAGLEGHMLVLVRKQGPTPAEYPRRPGVPERHPISEIRL